MPAPTNRLKERLASNEVQFGLWLGLASPLVAELCARRDYDWLLIDAEHSPNDIHSTRAQLQAIAQTETAAIVRVPIGEVWMIKQVLDLGAQTVLVPMVETAEQAAEMAAAMLYPPQGVRGVGASLARVSGFGQISDYLTTANEQACLIVQAESRRAVENAAAIAAVEGVHGVFIGPSDLAADMGHLGNPGAPEVQEAIRETLATIRAAGKAAGILTFDPAQARRYIDMGATFVAIGSDVSLLAGAVTKLRHEF